MPPVGNRALSPEVLVLPTDTHLGGWPLGLHWLSLDFGGWLLTAQYELVLSIDVFNRLQELVELLFWGHSAQVVQVGIPWLTSCRSAYCQSVAGLPSSGFD